MRQRLREARKTEKGFTLIELLIVIVILGVLSAVVVLAVGAFDDRGEESACKSDLKTVETAVEAYRAKHQGYPASIAVLTAADDQFLRAEPAGEGYRINYDAATGRVTGNLVKPAGGFYTNGNCEAEDVTP